MIETEAPISRSIFCPLLPIIALLLFACNASPTVPLPPPESIEVTVPDVYGFVSVMGESEYDESDIAMVFNENSENGAMSSIESDGTFEVEIEAEIGDTLIIRILHNGELSDEALEIVPSGS